MLATIGYTIGRLRCNRSQPNLSWRYLLCLIVITAALTLTATSARSAESIERPRSPATVWLEDRAGLNTESFYFHFHMLLEDEPRDAIWADRAERFLSQLLFPTAPARNYFPVKIECRSSSCEIIVETFDTNFGPWTQRISRVEEMADFKSLFVSSKGLIFEKAHGGNGLAMYWMLMANAAQR